MASKSKTGQKSVKLVVELYPDETDEIYVCGDINSLGGWDATQAKRLRYNEDGTYSIVVKCNTNSVLRYKYLSSQNWNSVECANDNGYIFNREIIVKDTKIQKDSIVRFKI